MTMPHLENCPHSPLGHCLRCHHEFVKDGLIPADQDDADPRRCVCGRMMGLIFSVTDDDDGEININWCAGCGVVHIHYRNGSGDSRYIPDPDLVGKA